MTISVNPAKTDPGGAGKRIELTVRGLILGALITVVFTAANVYLGLQAGLTFASSIPAAVISMAVLRMFKSSTIYENNIVQTVASAAGTLSSIIFVLPGLIIVGWWTGFPFWQSFSVCAVGGVLIASTGPASGGNGGRLGDANHFEGEVPIGTRWPLHTASVALGASKRRSRGVTTAILTG